MTRYRDSALELSAPVAGESQLNVLQIPDGQRKQRVSRFLGLSGAEWGDLHLLTPTDEGLLREYQVVVNEDAVPTGLHLDCRLDAAMSSRLETAELDEVSSELVFNRQHVWLREQNPSAFDWKRLGSPPPGQAIFHDAEVLVEDAATRMVFPYRLSEEYRDVIAALTNRTREVAKIDPAIVSCLRLAGILVSPAEEQSRLRTWAAMSHQYKVKGYLLVGAILPAPFLSGLGRYYRSLIEDGFVARAEDLNSASRPIVPTKDSSIGQDRRSIASMTRWIHHQTRGVFSKIVGIPASPTRDQRIIALPDAMSTHTDAMTRWIHHQIRGIFSKIVGLPASPTYNFFLHYPPHSYLREHVDDSLCEWTMTVSVSMDPPDGFNWPLMIRAIHSESEAEPLMIEPGQAAFYRGTITSHYRDPLPADRSQDQLIFCFSRDAAQ